MWFTNEGFWPWDVSYFCIYMSLRKKYLITGKFAFFNAGKWFAAVTLDVILPSQGNS